MVMQAHLDFHDIIFHDYRYDDYSDFEFSGSKVLESSELRLTLIRTQAADPILQWVPVYHYSIFSLEFHAVVGHITFRVSNMFRLKIYDGHIGYHIEENFRGHHFSQKACELLRPLFAHHHFETIALTCHPDNIASRKTIENLQARYIGTYTFKHVPDSTDTQKCVYQWQPDGGL